MQSLEERIAMLERRTSRYRDVAGFLLVALCAAVLIGAAGDDGNIEGRMLIIKNSEGQGVVAAFADEQGNGKLQIADASGQLVLVGGVSKDGGGGLVIASSGGPRVLLASKGDSGVLDIRGSEGSVVTVGADPQGNGTLVVNTKAGVSQFFVNSSSNGFSAAGYNKTGEGVVRLYADEYGNGVVYAGNRKGQGRTLEP